MSYKKGPLVTKDLIESSIARCEFHLFERTTKIVCVLTLMNGFTVSGEATALPTTEFNAETGMGIARQEAMNKAGDHLAFVAMDQMSDNPTGVLVAKALDALKEQT